MTLVYRDYDQATLDLECNPARSIPDHDAYLGIFAARSADSRRRRPDRRRVSYGSHPQQIIDIFPATKPDAALHIHIHGGGWRILTPDDSSFVIDGLAAPDVAVAAIGYRKLPAARLDEVVADARAAVAWLWQHHAELGVDPGRFHLSGHSAGAHLAGMVMADGWGQGYGVPDGLAKSAVLLSGNFDLEPLRLSYRNEWLRLIPADDHVLGPVHHVPRAPPPIWIGWGERESRQYKMQASDYASAWTRGGGRTELVELAGCHHLQTVLQLADPDSEASRAARELMATR